jgi:hypothetical protein
LAIFEIDKKSIPKILFKNKQNTKYENKNYNYIIYPF